MGPKYHAPVGGEERSAYDLTVALANEGHSKKSALSV
jgi:hypothetical protein